jgi:hypothetical protein
MNSYVVQSDNQHRWQATSGSRILVMDRGAVRFDFPKDWIPSADSKYILIVDRVPPLDRCGVMVACRRLSKAMMRIPIKDLLHEITIGDTDSRPIMHRGPIHPIFRPPLEAAWRQMHFEDPVRHREACTRLCLARGGFTLATIVFDFWPEDELRYFLAWNTLLETLAVGDYIEDPMTGRKREKRG